MLLEGLTRSTRPQALELAARRPYENAFLCWVLEGGRGTAPGEEIVLVRSGDGRLGAVAFFGHQLVVAGNDGSAVDVVAGELRNHSSIRSFLGARENIERIWQHVRHAHREPVLARWRQPVYVLHRERLAAVEAVADVRQATIADIEAVVEHSGAMMLGELGYDPRRQRTAFTAGVRRTIAAGLWWVWIVDGELRFMLNIGARTAQTAQLQGVWSPPAARGHGYATAALGAICAQLLRAHPTLSLYVNDFNAPAIALYERVGFVRDGEMATLLFS